VLTYSVAADGGFPTACASLEIRAAADLRPTFFMYLGRRGSLGRFSFELATATREIPALRACFVLSSSNNVASQIRQHGGALLEIDTFKRTWSTEVFTSFFPARRRLLTWLRRERPGTIVNLMPHMWTPLLRPSIQKLGITYVTVIHDVIGHQGDPTGYVTRWLTSEARRADVVVTLSRTVANHLQAAGYGREDQVHTLFHPDLSYGATPASRERLSGEPLKLLFFGRILKYKGLPLLLTAVEMLRAEGIAVELGVAGAGDLRSERARLASLGAEVTNRWLDDDEIEPLLARYHAIALPHIEATQSGVAAVAFGNCIPVIGMPVGGLVEQIVSGRTGVLASEVSASSLADAIRSLATNPAMYNGISTYLRRTVKDRSMERFVDCLLNVIREHRNQHRTVADLPQHKCKQSSRGSTVSAAKPVA
jgi:glycosyltransferase involved in cell wall biosynthesis